MKLALSAFIVGVLAIVLRFHPEYTGFTPDGNFALSVVAFFSILGALITVWIERTKMRRIANK